jgi:hypothetical protein
VTTTTPALTARPAFRFLRPTLADAAAASGVLAATILTVTAAFLAIAHLAGGLDFGGGTHASIVELLHVVTISLLVPLPFALHRMLGEAAPRASAAGVALAVDALAFGAILHALFAAGITTFDAAGPLVLIGYFAFAGWLWIVGSRGSDSGRLPGGRRMALVGATVIGLPLWLVWVTRHLAAR